MKILLFILLIYLAFNGNSLKFNQRPIQQSKKAVIALQLLDTFDKRTVENIRESISEFWHHKVIVLPIQAIPSKTYTPAVEAYSSDSILSFLSGIKQTKISKIVGITHKNIYAIKRVEGPVGGFFDLGIFGNSYLPGDCCVVSDYKLGAINEQEYNYALRNIIIHEMGHNYGLPHCPNPSCIMCEKNGSKIGLIKGKLDFCELCRSKLKYMNAN
jgi:archaemetzincin